MNKLTFRQYFKMNKQTTWSCLRICSIIFAGCATAISIIVKYSKGVDEDPVMVFIACELFGYAFALFIFILAITSAYAKAKSAIKTFYSIPQTVRNEYQLELIQRSLNPKYWFMEFDIVQSNGIEYNFLDQRTINEIKNRL